MTTTPSEIGELGAEALRDLVRRATSGAPVATYAEGESPISWEVLASGGWDQVGAVENGASLRDLVEIARAWGHGCIPLPFIPSLLAKRHFPAAAVHDGPVTLALPLAGTGDGYVPFGRFDGIRLALGGGELTDVPPGTPDPLAIVSRGIETGVRTTLSPAAAREVAVVLAAEATGGAERLLADSVAFAGEREQFGKPVGSFQAVKHHLADAAIAAELAETAVIWAAERSEEAFRGALFAVDRAVDLAELAIQVHGGLGFTWEMGLHFPLRQMMLARELIVGLESEHA
ncbi:acyl-CoA dehydrogenase family protein [Amycolatopsis thermoflava]|uniref:acyl-CoA dehydrogenase family protein n=1 Tax=Amycolatopsis thermoflava TaxID=84480 RepID=UPI0038237542